MIIVRMTGGLGNQMFQYAVGRRLADDWKTSLWLDTSAFKGAAGRGETPRTYRLNHFRVRARLMPALLRAVMLPFPRHLPARFAHLPHWPGFAKRVGEQGLSFNPGVLEGPKRIYMDGYWQTEKYFVSRAENIRSDFELMSPMTEERQVLAAQLSSGGSVSVHVRRGDYITNANANAFHGTCSPEWYSSGMTQMADEVRGARFFVFSDDPVWARENLPRFNDMVFVDPRPDGREFEDLHLMSKCRHHIIANSSYSWWGAWLNPSVEKKIIAPDRWFAAEVDTSDRIPAEWNRL